MGQREVAALIGLRDELKRKQSRYDRNLIEIGDFSYIDGVPMVMSWGEGYKVRIGKFCSIAANVRFYVGGDHRNDWISTYPFSAWIPSVYGHIKGTPHSKGDIVIGNDVWIGQNAKIMSGVHIGDGATVAGSAVVTRDVPPYALVAGNPAKIKKNRFPVGVRNILLNMAWWDWDIEKIAGAVPLLESGKWTEFAELYLEDNDGQK